VVNLILDSFHALIVTNKILPSLQAHAKQVMGHHKLLLLV